MKTKHFPDINSVDIESLNPYEFETFCAEYLQSRFWNAEVMGKSADQGVDVLAKKDNVAVAIQCKKYSSSVGNSAVQEVYTGRLHYNADFAVVVSNSGFTKAAQSLALSTGVKLVSVYQLATLDDVIGLSTDTDTDNQVSVEPKKLNDWFNTSEENNEYQENLYKREALRDAAQMPAGEIKETTIQGEISKLTSTIIERANKELSPYDLIKSGRKISLKDIIFTRSKAIYEVGEQLGINIEEHPWLAAYVYYVDELEEFEEEFDFVLPNNILRDPKIFACLELICDYGVSIGHLELGRRYHDSVGEDKSSQRKMIWHLYEGVKANSIFCLPKFAGELISIPNIDDKERRSKLFYCWHKFFSSKFVLDIPLSNDSDPCHLYELNSRNTFFETYLEDYKECQADQNISTTDEMQKGIDNIIRYMRYDGQIVPDNY